MGCDMDVGAVRIRDVMGVWDAAESCDVMGLG